MLEPCKCAGNRSKGKTTCPTVCEASHCCRAAALGHAASPGPGAAEATPVLVTSHVQMANLETQPPLTGQFWEAAGSGAQGGRSSREAGQKRLDQWQRRLG
jgi:hypothetical protein